MVELIERVDGVVVSARWTNWATSMIRIQSTEDTVAAARSFLDVAKNAVRPKEGEIKHSLPDRVTAVLPVTGRLTDIEAKAVEVARRMLMEFRRYNAKQPALPMNVSMAVTSGPVVIAPGIAEVNLNMLLAGEPVATAELMLNGARPDAILVSEATYTRIGFMYRGRPVDGPSPKMFELIL